MCDLDYNVPKVTVRQTETSGLEKYAAAQPHHLLRQTMTLRFQQRTGRLVLVALDSLPQLDWRRSEQCGLR